jgi:threonine/homoserine/homoserine lactone efflux protein
MWFLQCHELLERMFHLQSYAPAILVTAGAAVLIYCATSCLCAPSEEKDDIFHNPVC